MLAFFIISFASCKPSSFGILMFRGSHTKTYFIYILLHFVRTRCNVTLLSHIVTYFMISYLCILSGYIVIYLMTFHPLLQLHTCAFCQDTSSTSADPYPPPPPPPPCHWHSQCQWWRGPEELPKRYHLSLFDTTWRILVFIFRKNFFPTRSSLASRRTVSSFCRQSETQASK